MIVDTHNGLSVSGHIREGQVLAKEEYTTPHALNTMTHYTLIVAQHYIILKRYIE